jgi:prevent-host-death family protein
MLAVKISDFKAHLSEYIRQARNGVELEILDRTTPVARLVPVIKETRAEIIPAKKPSKNLGLIKPPEGIEFDGDVMEILMEERNRR